MLRVEKPRDNLTQRHLFLETGSPVFILVSGAAYHRTQHKCYNGDEYLPYARTKIGTSRLLSHANQNLTFVSRTLKQRDALFRPVGMEKRQPKGGM